MNDVVTDTPGGFLFEWWSVFWDVYIAKTNEKHSESAAEVGLSTTIWRCFFYLVTDEWL